VSEPGSRSTGGSQVGYSSSSVARTTRHESTSTLRDRIQRAHALVMDLAGGNPNVLIEVGMAIAMHKGESGALIILKPKNEPWPSNLQGIVYCNYDKSLQQGLEDQAGFRAALRTRILNVSKDRRMLSSEAGAG
jgi:hypothetical protein